jgi:hypothetical protein
LCQSESNNTADKLRIEMIAGKEISGVLEIGR